MERIDDYAIIGDCRSAALVSRSGSIDWLCWPRFDSPSVFGAILDDKAGRWSLAPAVPFRAERRYIEGTNVLEMLFSPRPGYASSAVRVRDGGKLGLRIHTKEGLFTLRTDMPPGAAEGDELRARAHLRRGDALHFSLTFAAEWPAILPPLGDWSRMALERSVGWWRRWAARVTYNGPCRAAVVRSALALRLLVFAPSGAVVAAPTTSLPERVGGDLNWDYRFCWLRDASLTVRALFGLGFPEEAETFVSWALHTTRLTRPELRVLYDVHGNQPSRERILGSWSGYRGSRPVRAGNAATDQFQLDVYGEVIDAVTLFVRQGGVLDRETRRMLCHFGRYVCEHWQEPDEGIWEPRSGKMHHTHSRVLCWTALDRLVELHSRGHLRGANVELFAGTRDRIRREVEARGWNPTLNSYVATLDGDDLDAGLLLLAWYGFAKPDSPRMRSTYARILERLGAGNGLLYRYRTAESPEEGAFGICSFWNAEYLALGGGTVEEAGEVLERLSCYANDVGLFGEEIDPATGESLGNFPQAFTHVGFINAALSLWRRLEGREALVRRVAPPPESPAPEARP